MNPYKAQFAVETFERTLTDALTGADVFIGLSTGGIVKGEMLKGMARDPIVFALANPEPGDHAGGRAARRGPTSSWRPAAATIPNQVNNVLGFPFIFRGALDVRATEINEAMKRAASQALAALAKMDVPDSVSKAYGGQTLPVRPRVPHPEALRSARAPLGRARRSPRRRCARASPASRSPTWAPTCGGSRRCSRARARS